MDWGPGLGRPFDHLFVDGNWGLSAIPDGVEPRPVIHDPQLGEVGSPSSSALTVIASVTQPRSSPKRARFSSLQRIAPCLHYELNSAVFSSCAGTTFNTPGELK